MLLNKEQVISFLPHRDPFLFIDGIKSIELAQPLDENAEPILDVKRLVGSTVTGIFNCHSDLIHLKGHFPGEPILPGVLQIEMMAQNGAFLALGLIPLSKFSLYKVHTKLVAVDRVKFRKGIIPPLEIIIETKLISSRGTFNSYQAKIYHDSHGVISEAEFMASVQLAKK
jgi:3-hydroxyacyl-[acyl-carrier-protein] dehydratase